MSKNKKISIPKFLIPDEARKLNNHIYKKTGCFLFLQIPVSKLFGPLPEKN